MKEKIACVMLKVNIVLLGIPLGITCKYKSQLVNSFREFALGLSL